MELPADDRVNRMLHPYSGLNEWRLARRATEYFLRSWRSAPVLYSLFLCAKAFCSHFYNDLKRLVRKRRAKKLRPSTIL